MAKIGEAFVVINAKLDKLKAQMRNALGIVRRGITRAAKVGVVAFGALSVASLKFASDVEETQNLFNESMGDMGKKANKFVTETSKKFGLFPRDVQNAMASFNLMLNAMGLGEEKAFEMSKALTQLGFDVSSFRNMNPEEAFDKMRAAISGETEPLKRLGVIINETAIKTRALQTMTKRQVKSMTEAEKVAIRYELIMEGLSKDTGDLERTQGSFANRLRQLISQFKELLATIGKPFLQPVADLFGKISQKMIDMTPKIKELAEGAADFVTNFIESQGGIEGIFQRITGFVKELIPTFQNVIGKLNELLPSIETIAKAIEKAATGLGNIKKIKDQAGGLARDIAGLGAVHIINQGRQAQIESVNRQRVLAGQSPVAGGSGTMGTGVTTLTTGGLNQEWLSLLRRIEANTRAGDNRI